MSPTVTKEHSTNDGSPELDFAEGGVASGSTEPTGAPPERAHGQANFALFLSFIAVLMALGALLAVAFKLDDTQSGGTQAAGTAGQSQPTTTGGPAAGPVNVGAGDDFFNPADITANAGKVNFAVVNNGKLLHEMVLAKTSADPASLPTKPDGSVDEEKLNSPGEVADVAPGTTKHGTIKLSPGKYVMFCNVPGHYAAGMYGTMTVK